MIGRAVSLDNGNPASRLTSSASRTRSKTLTDDSRAGLQGKMPTASAKVATVDNRVASAAEDETPKVAKILTGASPVVRHSR